VSASHRARLLHGTSSLSILLPLCSHHVQVSELIRVAADDRQLQEQHRLLLHQLSQLVRLIQQPNLRKPEEQMAAVMAHIKQVWVCCSLLGCWSAGTHFPSTSQ
jgi:hypothetical protein